MPAASLQPQGTLANLKGGTERLCMPPTHVGWQRPQWPRQALDRQLSSLEAGTATAAFSLESLLAEVEDLLSYCNDILGTGTPATPDLAVCHSCSAQRFSVCVAIIRVMQWSMW